MLFIADGLLIAGALAAAFYCWVLSRRVRSLANLDNGVGAAISKLSRQIDEVKSSLDVAKAVTGASRKELSELTARAEIAAGRLELLLAALHERGEAAPGKGENLRRDAERRRRRDRETGANAREATTEDRARGEAAPEGAGSAGAQEQGDATPEARSRGGEETSARRRRDVTPALRSVLKALDR